MTTTLATRRAILRQLTAEEVDEVRALTAGLPRLVQGWSVPVVVDDAALRLDAAMWALARRHDLDLCPECTVFDVADGLAEHGWSAGPARDALRAFVMLRSSRTEPVAAGRLLAYLELRTRFG